MRNHRLRFYLFFFLMSWMVSSAASQLQRISILNSNANALTLGFILKGVDQHKVFVLHQPERVVVDFTDTSITAEVNHLARLPGLLRQVRIGHPRPRVVRLVFEMRQAVAIKTALWQPYSGAQSSWRMTFSPSGKALAPKQSPRIKTILHQPARTNRDVIVVLDPGHGGKDPGATGLKHTLEKNVVLAISRRLKTLIDRQPGMRAVLTRDRDYYVGLRERMMIARKHNADLFIAIHADAFDNHNSHGASIFALSQRGATSEAARWLAEKENYSELGGVNLSALDDTNGVIRSVLIDLSQTATIGASLQLGRHILSDLTRITTLHSHKVEQARFMVLKSPDIPSLLIETGFISNPREEMNLNSPIYQARLSQAIFSGIKQYFWEYPPHGSHIEAMLSAGHHQAQSNLKYRRIK